MNFDNENRNGVPRVTGLPESQFRTPEVGSFMAENPKESIEPVFEEVNPLTQKNIHKFVKLKITNYPLKILLKNEKSLIGKLKT